MSDELSFSEWLRLAREQSGDGPLPTVPERFLLDPIDDSDDDLCVDDGLLRAIEWARNVLDTD